MTDANASDYTVERPILLANGEYWMETALGVWHRIDESTICHGIYWSEPSAEEWRAFRAAREAARAADGPRDIGDLLDAGPRLRAFGALPSSRRFAAFESFRAADADSIERPPSAARA